MQIGLQLLGPSNDPSQKCFLSSSLLRVVLISDHYTYANGIIGVHRVSLMAYRLHATHCRYLYIYIYEVNGRNISVYRRAMECFDLSSFYADAANANGPSQGQFQSVCAVSDEPLRLYQFYLPKDMFDWSFKCHKMLAS